MSLLDWILRSSTRAKSEHINKYWKYDSECKRPLSFKVGEALKLVQNALGLRTRGCKQVERWLYLYFNG